MTTPAAVPATPVAAAESDALAALPTFVRVTAAARKLGLSPQRARMLSDLGELPPRFVLGGRDDYFRADALAAAIKNLAPLDPALERRIAREARQRANAALGLPERSGRAFRARGSSEPFARATSAPSTPSTPKG